MINANLKLVDHPLYKAIIKKIQSRIPFTKIQCLIKLALTKTIRAAYHQLNLTNLESTQPKPNQESEIQVEWSFFQHKRKAE